MRYIVLNRYPRCGINKKLFHKIKQQILSEPAVCVIGLL